ncbi:MAG: nitrile hydratase accessory protein [Bacteroidetes bacterium]|nr:nitrile hydratase accessory protein [Bacteroidota bacterium]
MITPTTRWHETVNRKPFAAPWHGAAFALTVHLHERGIFSWPEWADALAAALREDENAGHLDGSDDYYNAWLNALQRLLQDRDIAAGTEVQQMMQAWRTAYLNTPHGAPVQLDPLHSESSGSKTGDHQV